MQHSREPAAGVERLLLPLAEVEVAADSPCQDVGTDLWHQLLSWLKIAVIFLLTGS